MGGPHERFVVIGLQHSMFRAVFLAYSLANVIVSAQIVTDGDPPWMVRIILLAFCVQSFFLIFSLINASFIFARIAISCLA